jgi:hypothetical protein
LASTSPPRKARGYPLVRAHVPAGAPFRRIIKSMHLRSPLGFGKGPSRFSDPRTKLPDAKRFGVLYLGSTLEVCFLEAVLRDRRNGVGGPLTMQESELEVLTSVQVEVAKPLLLADLRGNRPVVMGVPTDVGNAADQKLARRWSRFFQRHPDRLDGILYESRLNGELNVAVYDRSVTKLSVIGTSKLIEEPELGPILDTFNIALVP